MAGDFGSYARIVWRHEELAGHPDARHLLLYYYDLVRHTPGPVRHNGQVVACVRGQGVTSREEEMKATGLTERKVRTAREVLEKLGIVSYETTNRRTVFSFVDPEVWLPKLSEKVQQNVQRKLQNSSCGRPAESGNTSKYQENTPQYGVAWKYTPMGNGYVSLLNLKHRGNAEGAGKNHRNADPASVAARWFKAQDQATKGFGSPPPGPAVPPSPDHGKLKEVAVAAWVSAYEARYTSRWIRNGREIGILNRVAVESGNPDNLKARIKEFFRRDWPNRDGSPSGHDAGLFETVINRCVPAPKKTEPANEALAKPRYPGHIIRRPAGLQPDRSAAAAILAAIEGGDQ